MRLAGDGVEDVVRPARGLTNTVSPMFGMVRRSVRTTNRSVAAVERGVAVDVGVRAELLDQVDDDRHAALGRADQVAVLRAEADGDLAVAALGAGRRDLLAGQRDVQRRRTSRPARSAAPS